MPRGVGSLTGLGIGTASMGERVAAIQARQGLGTGKGPIVPGRLGGLTPGCEQRTRSVFRSSPLPEQLRIGKQCSRYLGKLQKNAIVSAFLRAVGWMSPMLEKGFLARSSLREVSR
jgi:hypothetical protein